MTERVASTGENASGEAMCCDGRTVVEHREANGGTCCVDRDGVAMGHGHPHVHDHGHQTGNNGGPMKTLKTRDEIVDDWFAARRTSYVALTASAAERLGEEPYWALISQDERDEAAKNGDAMPDGSYPTRNCDEVDKAVKAVGRGGADHDAIRRHIIKAADKHNCGASAIPDNWNADGSLKDEGSSESTTTDGFAAPPSPPDGGKATPPVAAEPPAAGGSTEKEDPADTKVDSALAKIREDVEAAIKAEQADMLEDGESKSKVLDNLNKLASLLKDVEDAQASDVKTESDEDEPPEAAKPGSSVKDAPIETPPAEAGLSTGSEVFADGDKPGNAEGVPGDADDSPPAPGDIEDNVECQNPNCGHLASAHQDLAEGENSGPCEMNGCECPGMVPPGEQVIGPDDNSAPQAAGDTTGGPNNVGGDEDMTSRFADIPPAPEAPPVEGAPASQLPVWNPDPNVVTGPAFSIPVGWFEGVETGDGRMIDPGALTWRVPPLPLMFLDTSPHDPSGFSPNDPAELVGRIEEITVEDGTGKAKGHFLNTEAGVDAAETLEQMGRMGVSIDVGSAEVEITGGLPIIEAPVPGGPVVVADDAEIPPMLEHLVKGEVMGITMCPFPAFAGAYIVLGDGSDVPSEPMPAPTVEQASMAIRYVDSVECEPCSRREAVVASSNGRTGSGVTLLRERHAVDGAGPVAPPRAWFEDPKFGAPGEDPRLRETIDARTGLPSGRYACPITITASGEYFGHVAQWGVCHQSPSFLGKGQCVLAPRSRTGYSWFHGRGSVLTAEGDVLDVGRITADVGHASTSSSMTAAMAIAHYDNSGLCAAAVRAGEDDYGIWVHGAVHPSVSPEQVYTLRLCPPSGDWRPVGAGSELVAVLHVNEPGFPVAKAHIEQSTGRVTSLVAAGVPLFELPTVPEPTLEERIDQIERGLAPVLRMAVSDAKSRMAALRSGT